MIRKIVNPYLDIPSMKIINQHNFDNNTPWLSKCTNWLDAAIEDSFTYVSENMVATWIDQINGNVWQRNNASYNCEHVSGSGYVTFDSFSLRAGLYLANSFSNNREVFIVGKRTVIVQTSYLLGAQDGYVSYIYDNTHGGGYTFVNLGSVSNIYKNITTNDLMAFSGNYNYIGGTKNANALIGQRSNNTYSFLGNVYEVLFFSTALTDDERTSLFSYMKAKHPTITNL